MEAVGVLGAYVSTEEPKIPPELPPPPTIEDLVREIVRTAVQEELSKS